LKNNVLYNEHNIILFLIMSKTELLKHCGMTQNTPLTDDELILLLNFLETENEILQKQQRQ
jgi:hypothetical protein